MLNPADDAFEKHLRTLLPAAAFREATDAYFTESRDRWRGHGLVVAPASTEEVAACVKACAEARIGIVPYGGGTGLVGGQIMEDGPRPVILSLERMNRIREVFADENVLIAEGGTILVDIQSAAKEIDRLFPLSLASEGSARIGGLLATNAGGINTLRYGNARAQCLGLEVVTADGAVWHGLSRLRKDNTGYDLRDLIIGSEGSLGIITAAALQLSPPPRSVSAAILAVPSPQAALSLLSRARAQVGNQVSAFEIIHRQGLNFLSETGLDHRPPFADPSEWMVLVELGLSGEEDAEEALGRLFEGAAEEGLATDGVIARSDGDRADFWHLRETIPAANRRIGSVSSHDISLPLSVIPEFIEEGAKIVAAVGEMRINCFGHLGDGNLHYNVFPGPGKTRADYGDARDAVKKAVHDLVHRYGGSVSAEHGIGRLKVGDLETYSDATKLRMLRAIKAALDPHGILNPGAVLAAS